MEIRRAAILIISDEASKDLSLDHAAKESAPILAKEEKWELSAIRIVPNDFLQIQQAVCDWTSGPNWHHLVLLSAATGLGAKDNSLEVSGSLGSLLANRLSYAKDITLGYHFLNSSTCPGPGVSDSICGLGLGLILTT